jgi:hypothetical protein
MALGDSLNSEPPHERGKVRRVTSFDQAAATLNCLILQIPAPTPDSQESDQSARWYGSQFQAFLNLVLTPQDCFQRLMVHAGGPAGSSVKFRTL